MSPATPQMLEEGIQFRCPRCQRAAVVTTSEALRYLREGWPVCCDGLMLYSAPPAHAAPRSKANEIEISCLK